MLKDTLLQDFKNAMKSKNLTDKNTIQLLRASILNKEKDLKRELTDIEIQQIVASEIKKRNDAIDLYQKNNQPEKAHEIVNEISVLKIYLPKPFSVQELTDIINNCIVDIEATSIKDMGKVIKAVKDKVGASADGKTISDLVKSILGGK